VSHGDTFAAPAVVQSVAALARKLENQGLNRH
jgi:hypothetical protein